jgi:apolipoprotein N-acyltransferase
MQVLQSYARRVRDLAARGAEVVVLPEKFVAVRPEWAAEARSTLAAAAREGGVTVVAGFNEWCQDGTQTNRAVVFSPSGEVAGEYFKQHLIPGFESAYQRGESLLMLPGGFGVAICKDMDFPALGRRYSESSAGLLLMPGWDFGKDGPMHARMAVLRGVEGGFAVARAAQEGVLTVSDQRGRILVEVASSDAPEVLVVSPVQLGSGRTVYAQVGDAFGLLCFVAALGFLMAARVRKPRRLDGNG